MIRMVLHLFYSFHFPHLQSFIRAVQTTLFLQHTLFSTGIYIHMDLTISMMADFKMRNSVSMFHEWVETLSVVSKMRLLSRTEYDTETSSPMCLILTQLERTWPHLQTGEHWLWQRRSSQWTAAHSHLPARHLIRWIRLLVQRDMNMHEVPVSHIQKSTVPSG